MHLSKDIPLVTDDAPAFHQVCQRITARRLAERHVLPALESVKDTVSARVKPASKFGWPEILILLGILAMSLAHVIHQFFS